MATTESRSGFRLPWSADRAPSRDGSDENSEREPYTGDSELSAPEVEPAEALEPTSDADAGDSELSAPEVEPTEAIEPTSDSDSDAATESDAGAAKAMAPAPGDALVASLAPVASRVADPAPARRPSKFLIDLTHAMQVAAEQARAATLEQFRVEGSTYVEQIQGRSIADADALRRRADEDVASIKEWSKAEIARIREESEKRMAGRRGQLDGQLGRHAALVECDVTRIQGQITSFEAEMAAFFDELLAETDLTILAARAQQMPEAPAFDELDDTAFTALMTEPAVGIPIAEPEPIAETPTTALEAEAVTVADTAPATMLSPTGDLSFDRDAAMAAIQAAAEAAASVEAATAEAARAEAAADRAESAAGNDAGVTAEATGLEASADTSAAELDAAPPSAPEDGTPARDPRLAMLGLTPDFAAAEAEAAEAAAAEISEIPELDEENLAARLAGLVAPSTSGAPADALPAAPMVSTQVVVTGLISVASIASFKRHLSRYAGVRHVGVSSGPDGEFLFTVQHEAEVSLRDLIPTLPGFQARVTGGGDGVVTASAHDPED